MVVNFDFDNYFCVKNYNVSPGSHFYGNCIPRKPLMEAFHVMEPN